MHNVIMLSVANNLFMLSVIMPSVFILNVIQCAMRLHHSLDGSTYLWSKLLCFASTNYFPQRIERASF
jgi:hypothetical protein